MWTITLWGLLGHISHWNRCFKALLWSNSRSSASQVAPVQRQTGGTETTGSQPTCSQGTPAVCGHSRCCVWHTRCTDSSLPQADPLFHNKPRRSAFLNVDCVWIWHKAFSKNAVQSLGFDMQGELKAHKCRDVSCQSRELEGFRGGKVYVPFAKSIGIPHNSYDRFSYFLKRACNCWNKAVSIICSSAGNS